MQTLILIDIQNDYFPGGAMELAGSEEAVLAAGRLLVTFRERLLPVVHIRHVSDRPGATFFLPGTHGAEIHALVAPMRDEPVFTKHFPNALRETPLAAHLNELDRLGGLRGKLNQLVFAGMMTHICVDATVRAAFDLGYSCLLAHDACATRDLSFGDRSVTAKDVQTAYMSALNGLFAVVRCADDILNMPVQ
jgi:nicotinamidase-related amidase